MTGTIQDMAQIHLRPAHSSDKQKLQKLYCQTIDHTCIDDYDELQRAAWKQGTENQQRWNEALQDQYFLVAEIAGEMAGFGSLANGTYIDFMYTSKKHLRKGVAEQIYRNLEAEAVKMGARILVSDVSKTARSFFEKQGFVVVKENNNRIRGVQISNYRMQKILDT